MRRKPLSSGRRSKFEDKVAKELEKHGIKFEYESIQLQYQEPLRKNLAECGDCGSTNLLRTGWYTPDFILSNGIIIEAKGRFTAADRRKMLAVKAAHPDERIVMLFMRDQPIAKGSKTFYSDWCHRHDIEFAIGQPHKEWYNG